VEQLTYYFRYQLFGEAKGGIMWLFRPAYPAEAAEACRVIRRSVKELCSIDHGGDPGILDAWLANKTPERVLSWIEANPGGVLVSVGAGGIAGVGCMMPDATIVLNYVAPWAQRQGIGKGLVRMMEGVAAEAGHDVCTLRSTATAEGFYLACGYEAAGEPIRSFGGKPAYPMRRVIT